MKRRAEPVMKVEVTTSRLRLLLVPLTAAVRLCRRILFGATDRAKLGSMSEGWVTQHRSSRPKH